MRRSRGIRLTKRNTSRMHN